jgi:hypothetical protein
MKLMLPLIVALTAALAAVAQAQEPNPAPAAGSPAAAAPAGVFGEGQRVVLVGEVSSAPKKIAGVSEQQKMQVAVGPARTDYTLHLNDAAMLGANGQKIAASDLDNKKWVRAEGTIMDDPRRIKVTKLQVIGKDLPGLQSSAFYRSGLDQGYVMAVAGSREVFPDTSGAVSAPSAMVVVGKVSDDTGPLENTRKIQVDAAGNTWTLDVPKDAPIFDTKGQKISVHAIAKGQWLRAHGWQTDDLRVRAARLEEIGPEDAFRTTTYYRETEPIGYVERISGTGVQFNPYKITGVVTAVNEGDGTVTVRDDQGKEHVILMDTAMFSLEGRPVAGKTIQQGQKITVEGSEITY